MWTPLQPQPAGDQLVLRQRYAYHSVKEDYRKRVTWIEGRPSVAMYEYAGTAPAVLPPHDNSRTSQAEHIRTMPEVIDRIRSAVETERRKPRDVYTHMTTQDASFYRPRDHKQVRNVAQTVNNEPVGSKCKNAADELQQLVGRVYMNIRL